MVINFLAKTMSPFSIIERQSFHALLGKHVVLKMRTGYSCDILPKAYEGVKQRVIKMISNAQAINATSDFYSNCKGSSMRLELQHVYCQFDHNSITLHLVIWKRTHQKIFVELLPTSGSKRSIDILQYF